MPKMSLSELKAMLAAEKADALAAVSASKLSHERADAMDYYLGDMTRDMPAPEGRSRAVSTDVADTIEGLMPSLMEIFCGGDEVVRFEPVGPDDVQAAEQESDYVNHVFVQVNPGFLILYSFIKEWWETRTLEERETYYDQPDDVYALLVADPDVEILAQSERVVDEETGAKLHDLVLARRRTQAHARIDPVPPEEFGIARNARSLRDCDYCFHKVLIAEGKLIAQGFDADKVRGLPSYPGVSNTEEIARDSVDEFQLQGDSLNAAARRIEVTEHYVRMDYEGDGNPLLYKVTSAGGEGDILTKDGKPDIEPVDVMPFAAMTPVIITHRFFGRSIADLVMDIQRIKTALLRAMLDNAYLANNPRVEVAEQYASSETLDDLLVSRPGGIVRTKQPGGLNWQQVPTIGGHVFPALEYMDSTREWRTGVTRQGQGIDASALQNQSATAVNQAFTAAQARMRLIARIFAETGIRDLFALVHATIRKHGEEAATFRLRNQWITVDPRDWKSREHMTINVGLGHGTRSERLAQVMALIGLQKEALAGGLTNLVSLQNLYNSAKEVSKLVGLPDVDRFFTDPKTQPPPPPPAPDPSLTQAQAMIAIEDKQAQAEIANRNNKTQAEMALAQQKFEFDKQLALLEHELKARDQQFRHLQGALGGGAAAGTAGSAPGDGGDASPSAGAANAALIAELVQTLRQVAAPKRVVRDAQGRVSHLETVPPGA